MCAGAMYMSGTNDAQDARRVVQALWGPGKLSWSGVTFVEVCASRTSMSARHVAALGGASLRIVKMAIGPRRGRGRPRLLRNKRGASRPRKCYDLAPPELCAGRVVNWELDADNPVHMRALGSFLRSLRLVPGTSRCHLHTSPPCAPFSKAQWWNVARGLYRRDWRAAGVLRLRLMRRLHAEVRRSDVEWTSSHEQPQGSSLSHVQGAQDWPWALRRSASRQRVAGCAVGLRCASGFFWQGVAVRKRFSSIAVGVASF